MGGPDAADARGRTHRTRGKVNVTHADIDIDWSAVEKERKAIATDYQHKTSDADWQSEGIVTLKEFANAVGKDRNSMRRRLLKHGIEFIRVRTYESRGQVLLAMTPEELEKAKALYTYGKVD
jgi:hypothetical protein